MDVLGTYMAVIRQVLCVYCQIAKYVFSVVWFHDYGWVHVASSIV